MKRTVIALLAAHAVTAAAWAVVPGSFTYQGRLDVAGSPATGTYDMQFGLFAAPEGGVPSRSVCVQNVAVVNGLFTATIDFGPSSLQGNYIGVRVRPDGPADPCDPADATYTDLAPRQPITPAPVASELRNVYVDASGRVGVGSPSPLAQLEVQGGANSDGSSDPVALALGYRTGGFRHFIRTRHDGAVGAGNAMEFYLNSTFTAGGSSSPGAGNTLAMALSGAQNGSVGIRNANPSAPLSVTAFTSGGRNDLLTFRNAANSDRWLLRLSSNDLVFSDTITDRFTFGASGSLGIGNTNPTAPLSMKGRAGGPSSSDELISLRNASNVEKWNLNLKGDDLTFWDTATGTDRVKIGRTDATALNVRGTTRTHILTITGGADIAEPFNVSSDHPVQPGMVVSIDAAHIGELRVCTNAYDTSVLGIISGANGVNPGLTLTQEGSVADGKYPVALTGRVWVLADANSAPIAPGDLLTTSATPGHAMKAADREKSHGATIGKAMSSLDSGTGYVLVVVNLQ